jgi:hypothetical protein
MNKIKTKCVVYTLVDTVRIRSSFLRKMLRHSSTMIDDDKGTRKGCIVHSKIPCNTRRLCKAYFQRTKYSTASENEMKFKVSK